MGEHHSRTEPGKKTSKESYDIVKGYDKTTGRVTYGREVAESGLSYLEVHLGLGETALRTMEGNAKADIFYARNTASGLFNTDPGKSPTPALHKIMGVSSSQQAVTRAETSVKNVFAAKEVGFRGGKNVLDLSNFVDLFGGRRASLRLEEGLDVFDKRKAKTIEERAAGAFDGRGNRIATPAPITGATSVTSPTNILFNKQKAGPGVSYASKVDKKWGNKYGTGSSIKNGDIRFGDPVTRLREEYFSKQALSDEIWNKWRSRGGATSFSDTEWNGRLRGRDAARVYLESSGFRSNASFPEEHQWRNRQSPYFSGINTPQNEFNKGSRRPRLHSEYLGNDYGSGLSFNKNLPDDSSQKAQWIKPGGGRTSNLTNSNASMMGMSGLTMTNAGLGGSNPLVAQSLYALQKILSTPVPAATNNALNSIMGVITGVHGVPKGGLSQGELNSAFGGGNYYKPYSSTGSDGTKYTGWAEPWDVKRPNKESSPGFFKRLNNELTGNIPVHQKSMSVIDRLFGGGGGGESGGGGRGGLLGQALTQFRHAAIWQMYTPVIGAVGYGTYRALTGDPATDRAAHSMIGVGATQEQRAGAREWAYDRTSVQPYSTTTQFLKGYKETASGLGIPLTDKSAPMLQSAAEKARLFSMFSMEDPNVAARRLSRATLMESKARGIDSPEGKMEIYNRLANNLAGLYAESSTRGQETDVAMHYMGPAALGKMKWGYDEAAAVNSHFVEQGIAGSTSGVFFRNMASNPNVMAEAVKARMFWEKAYENKAARGGKELQRQDLPLSYLNKAAWTTNGMEKNPEKAARVKEMLYRSSQGQKILTSGIPNDQHKFMGQASQDWLRLQEAGIKGLAPPQSMMPMVEMIGQQTPQEYADTMTGNVNKIKQTPHQMEQARTEDHRIDTASAGVSVMSNQWSNYFGSSFLGGIAKWYGKKSVASHYGSKFTNLLSDQNVKSSDIMKLVDEVQMQRNAGVLSDTDIAGYKADFKMAAYRNAMHARATGGSAPIKEIYDKMQEAGMTSGSFLPVSMQNEGQQRITEDRMKAEKKSISDIIKEGFLQVHIDPQQVTELRQALGGADPYSVKELPDGQLQIQLKPPTRKPESPNNPPHNGVNNTTGLPYTWGYGQGTGGGSGTSRPPVSGGVITQ